MVPLTTVSPKCLHGRVVKTSELKRWFEPPWTEISIFLHTNLYFYMQTCTFAYKRTDFCVQIYTPTYKKNYTFTYEPTHLPFIYKLDFFLQINTLTYTSWHTNLLLHTNLHFFLQIHSFTLLSTNYDTYRVSQKMSPVCSVSLFFRWFEQSLTDADIAYA